MEFNGFTQDEINVIASADASLSEKRNMIHQAALRNSEDVNEELGWFADESGYASEKVEYVRETVVASVLSEVQNGEIRFSLIEIVEALLEGDESAEADYWRDEYFNSKTYDEERMEHYIRDAYSDDPVKRYAMLSEL